MSTREKSTIASHMTAHPHTIGRDQSLARAHEMMRAHGFRHLPVLDGGRIVGIASSRDLDFVGAIRGVKPEEVTVEDAMSPAPYSVAPTTPLAEVCATMAEHHYGCALIMEDGRVRGIFTTVDALRLLAERTRAH